MEIDKLMETMALAQRLKDNPRHSWTAGGRRESVAEHCWPFSCGTSSRRPIWSGCCICA